MKPSSPRVALVHDFLLDLRGAERVFLALCDLFPEADIFTAVYDPAGTEGRFAHRNVHTSFLQRLRPNATLVPAPAAAVPVRHGGARPLRLRPRAEQLAAPGRTACCRPRTRSTSATATTRSATPGTRARRRCARSGRSSGAGARRRAPALAPVGLDRRPARRPLHRELRDDAPPRSRGTSRATPRSSTRRWRSSASRPASSATTTPSCRELMPHKRIDLAVRAFNELRRPLVVIGDGPDARRLQRLAGPTVRFTGRVSDAEVARLLATSRALVVTATEEFGIAAVEAQAAGRPVIALDEGGVTESVAGGPHRRLLRGGDARGAGRGRRRVRPAVGRPRRRASPTRSASAATAFAQEIRANVEPGAGRRPEPPRGPAPPGARARARRPPGGVTRPPGARVRVAVVVPNRDGRRWLPGLLAALRAQTRAAGPRRRRRRRLARRLGRVAARRGTSRSCARGVDGGFAAAVNAGVAAVADCDAVALVNTDVVLAPDWLARIVERAGGRTRSGRGGVQDGAGWTTPA